jgi:aminoglycoside/choline kinase family phosphotransferase/choline kinase
MILAAGFGSRLRPITDSLPKPLIPIGDSSLLENVLLSMAAAGVQQVAVNTHHLPESFEEFAAVWSGTPQISLFHEPEILGTGGGPVNAREFLTASDYFLLHNGDVLSDADLSRLCREQEKHAPLATMLLTEGHENKVLLAHDGSVLDILGKTGVVGGPGSRLLTYTGIVAISARIFDFLPSSGPASLPAALIQALRAQPGCVRGLAPENLYWNDVGTLQRYLSALDDVFSGRVKLPSGQGRQPITAKLEPLVEQGSDRVFLRMPLGLESFVLMLSPAGNPDNQRFLDIGGFLQQREIGTPKILAHSGQGRTVLLEDLGDNRLFDLARAADSEAELRQLYHPVLEFLAGLAGAASREIDACPAASGRALDYDALRWESDYFREYCLENLLGLTTEQTRSGALQGELEELARAASQLPQVFVHRDFQSQNILFKNDAVRIVDFQGARRGPLGYDLASLLLDPYVDLPEKLRFELRDYYRQQLVDSRDLDISAKLMEQCYLLTGLQRCMQALGAYGFLSLVKQKPGFKAFVASGLLRLAEGLVALKTIETDFGTMPTLAAIVQQAGSKWDMLQGKSES